MEGNNVNVKLLDINGIPLLKWYLPNKKDTDQRSNTEEINRIEKREMETVRNEILPEFSSNNVEKTTKVLLCNNLPIEETNEENTESNISSVLQSSEQLSNNPVIINDSSMENIGTSAINSMSYNLRERTNRKNESKVNNILTNARAPLFKEKSGRKRKILSRTSPSKISAKYAKKSLFNEQQTAYLNKTPLIKKIKCDLIEKELSLKKIKRTLSKWMNSECSPLERNEALSLLENVKTIQADLTILRGKLKFEKLLENRNILKKGIDELTSLTNKINKQLIDVIVECDIQHERLTEEVNDINSVFSNIVSIDQPISNEYNKKPCVYKKLFQPNFNNFSLNPSAEMSENIITPSQQMSKEINKYRTEIIFSPNELQTIKQLPTLNYLVLNSKQEKLNFNLRGNKDLQKKCQRKTKKEKCSIVKLKKPKKLLKSEVNQTLKLLANLTLTNQTNESTIETVHSKNLTSGILKNISEKENCPIGGNLTEEIEDNSYNYETNAEDSDIINSSQITENSCINSSISCSKNKRVKLAANNENEINENQTLKCFNQESDLCETLPTQDKLTENGKIKPLFHETIIANTSPFQNKEQEENDTLQTCNQNSTVAKTLNTPKISFDQDSVNADSLKKQTKPVSVNLKRKSPLPIKLKTLNSILQENFKTMVHNKSNNIQNKEIKYAKCFVKNFPLNSQTNTMCLKNLNNCNRTSNLKVFEGMPKMSQNTVDKYEKNYVTKNNFDIILDSNENIIESSEILPTTKGTSSMNVEYSSQHNLNSSIIGTNNSTSFSRSDETIQHDKIFDDSRDATKCQDHLLILSNSEVQRNDETDNVYKHTNKDDDNIQRYTLTSNVVNVKDQETQTVSFQDGTSNLNKTADETKEILKCIDLIKTMRVKSEHEFVPINDLSNLIAADDFTWQL